jgi:hypothetical protein
MQTMAMYRIVSEAGADLGTYEAFDTDAALDAMARAAGYADAASVVASVVGRPFRGTVEEVHTTYTIETKTDGQWTSDGLGDSTGWESREAAERAIESLRSMGGEWATSEYRIVEVQS